jgi:hypothetical protein
MRFYHARDFGITLPGNISFSFDRLEVFFGGGVVCLVLSTVVVKQAELLVWIGIALLVLWVVMTVLATLGVINSRTPRGPRQGGGSAPDSSPDVSSAP